MTSDKIIEGIKTAVGIVVGIGVTALCSALAGNIASENNFKPVEKLCAGIAGAVVGGIVSEHAEKYIDSTVDQITGTAKIFSGIAKELRDDQGGEAHA